jgi:hypothetical protein
MCVVKKYLNMYHTTMKHFIISMYILLSLIFVSIPVAYAQEETDSGMTYEESLTTVEESKNVVTLDETFIETTPKLNFLQVAIAILAPATFITIAYLLIKKMKL